MPATDRDQTRGVLSDQEGPTVVQQGQSVRGLPARPRRGSRLTLTRLGNYQDRLMLQRRYCSQVVRLRGSNRHMGGKLACHASDSMVRRYVYQDFALLRGRWCICWLSRWTTEKIFNQYAEN